VDKVEIQVGFVGTYFIARHHLFGGLERFRQILHTSPISHNL
jgi:hypothetical protein